MAFDLSHDSRRYLLDLARRSIALSLEKKDETGTPPTDPALHEPRGAFVTLKRGGTLRGCIGRLETGEPLWRTVVEMARAAAFEDPRFPAVSPGELPGIEVEISVLTPFEPLSDPGDIEIGTHGLLIEKGYHRGVLLPQVATEQGWGAEEFLAHVCLKASLPPTAWNDADTRLFVFSALVFGD
jgi:AmmeMemoRadiSam system protein A